MVYLTKESVTTATDYFVIVLPNIRQVFEHWLLRHPEHADNPERSLVLAKSVASLSWRCKVNTISWIVQEFIQLFSLCCRKMMQV